AKKKWQTILHRLLWAFLICVAILALLNAIPNTNVAKDVAMPLDRDLVSHSAVKNCESGDGGHGPDNTQPWYGSTYELPVGRTEAIALINDIASKHGFKLHQATKKDQATMGGETEIADIYLPDNYIDFTSNPTHVSPGPIYLTFTLPKKDQYCTGSNIPSSSDANHTVISLSVSNPRK
ncbi:MAG TPA: hypothetical protein VNX65_04995, partial [Patescibacteria group bacterium]|nr:hypothetical protein [Patescibacteria group bacterium]